MAIEEQINVLIREVLARAESIAIDAVRDAFASKHSRRLERPIRTSGAGPARRSGKDLELLRDRLYAEICAQPGGLMKLLAERLHVSPRDLNIPARQLASAGKIRKTGARNTTRYFPIGRTKS